jgi:uncharacterized membrane protein
VTARRGGYSLIENGGSTIDGRIDMSVTRESIDVDVDVSTAYDQWTQFEMFPEFMSGVDGVRQLDDRHLHWKINIGGVTREYDATITEQRPDEIISWRGDGETDNTGTVTFERLDDHRTRIDATIGYQTDGVAEKMGDAIHLPQRQLRNDLFRFKRFIESSRSATGGWRGEI